MNLLVVSEQPGQSGPYIKAAGKVGWRIACESSYEHRCRPGLCLVP